MRKYGENVTVSLTGISTSAELGRKKGSEKKGHIWSAPYCKKKFTCDIKK